MSYLLKSDEKLLPYNLNNYMCLWMYAQQFFLYKKE
jgi:hypothetical protein